MTTQYPTRDVVVEIDPWRVVDGYPVPQAPMALAPGPAFQIGALELSSGFKEPSEVRLGATYRWHPMDFLPMVWRCRLDVEEASAHRSWRALSQEMTFADALSTNWTWLHRPGFSETTGIWSDLAEQSWADIAGASFRSTLYNQAQLPSTTWTEFAELDYATAMESSWRRRLHPTFFDHPEWEYFTGGAISRSDYTYYRAGRYAPASAVMFDAGDSLALRYDTVELPQLTMLVVAVLRPPAGRAYTILSALGYLELRFTASGQVELECEGRMVSAPCLGGRSRPNEPVMVGVSVSPGEPALYLMVIDTSVRVLRMELPSSQTVSHLSWRLAPDRDASMDVLEVSMFTDRMVRPELARIASRLDQMYGVTLP